MAFYAFRLGTANPLTSADDLPGVSPDDVTNEYTLIGKQRELAEGTLVEDIIAYRATYSFQLRSLTHAQRERLEVLRRTAGTVRLRDERGLEYPVRFITPVTFTTIPVSVEDPQEAGRYFRYNAAFAVQVVTAAGSF